MGDTGTWIGVGVAPRLLSATMVSDRVVRANFSEVMRSDAEFLDPTNYVFTPLLGGVAVVANLVTAGTDLTYATIRTAGSFSPGIANYKLTVDNAIADAAGNTLDPLYDEDTFNGIAPALAPRLQYKGLLESIIEAVSETDAEISGLRMTRLTVAAAKGDTFVDVETTLDWPSTGQLAIDGVVYSYTGKTAVRFTGISHIANGSPVSGVATVHRDLSTVTDLNRAWSALDQLRRAILVDYAEGENLEALARNLGVERERFFGADDLFREVVKTIAYNPRGTIFGLELFLTALYGAGNFEVFEDLLQYPNTVFVRVDGVTLGYPLIAGKSFLEARDFKAVNNFILTLTHHALAVESVRLLEVNELFDFRGVKPSGVTYAYYPGATPAGAFDFIGSNEATEVLLVTNEGIEMVSAGSTVKYNMPVSKGYRVNDRSNVEITWLGSAETIAVTGQRNDLHIYDGAKDIHFRVDYDGVSSAQCGLFNIGSGHLGTPVPLAASTYYEFRLIQTATNDVELWIDNVLVQSIAYSAFATTISVNFDFGVTGSGAKYRYKQIGVKTETPDVWRWMHRDAAGSVATANPTRLTDLGSHFGAELVGKQLVILSSSVLNPQNGDNSGDFIIDVRIDADNLELKGKQRAGLEIVNDSYAGFLAILPSHHKLRWPNDLGKKVVISGSSAGNNGTYTINRMFMIDTVYLEIGVYFTDYQFHTESNIVAFTVDPVAPEDELTYRVDPAFVTESNLNYDIGNAGTILPSPSKTIWISEYYFTFPWDGALMEVAYTTQYSGQIREAGDETTIESLGPPVLYSQYPFFLGEPLADLRMFLDEMTAAGVIPEVEIY